MKTVDPMAMHHLLPRSACLVIFLAVGLLGFSQSLAPEVIGNAGMHVSQPNVQLSWTVGEMMIETQSQSQAVLTQGFHQTNLVITALDNSFPAAWNIDAFPNPTTQFLHIRWGETDVPVSIRFSNMTGQVLLSERLEGPSETTLNVDRFTQGNYLLEVVDEAGKRKKTFKVQVIR